MKVFEIWIGAYHLGQGYDPVLEPTFLGRESSIDFSAACLKYELKRALEHLERCEKTGEYFDNQSREWFYNPNSNSNSWTGPYFQTKEEAQKSSRERGFYMPPLAST